MDFKSEKISNTWILAGWCIGLIFQIKTGGITQVLTFICGALLPVALLFLLFLMRMLGAGDIKLLSVLGGYMGPGGIFTCTLCSFVCGAVISLFILIYHHIFFRRLLYFFNYFNRCITKKKRISYRCPGRRRPEHIHFSAAILISILLWIGGIYS
ncbi:prepilin peptidase [Blautia liquoris]|uniref:Prepilin peptidase n=2 Tax=Blautia liquoris TaxID=2779518 RepID=A0A7M2RGP2_9FIRM|nr:prepilin peptidase [Blautia liquoris]